MNIKVLKRDLDITTLSINIPQVTILASEEDRFIQEIRELISKYVQNYEKFKNKAVVMIGMGASLTKEQQEAVLKWHNVIGTCPFDLKQLDKFIKSGIDVIYVGEPNSQLSEYIKNIYGVDRSKRGHVKVLEEINGTWRTSVGM